VSSVLLSVLHVWTDCRDVARGKPDSWFPPTRQPSVLPAAPSNFVPFFHQGSYCGPVAGNCCLGGLLFGFLFCTPLITMAGVYGSWQNVYLVSATTKKYVGYQVCGMGMGTSSDICVCLTTYCVTWLPPCVWGVMGCKLRDAVAKTHGIDHSSPAQDFIYSLCCPTCSLCQVHRQVRSVRAATSTRSARLRGWNGGRGAGHSSRGPGAGASASDPAAVLKDDLVYTAELRATQIQKEYDSALLVLHEVYCVSSLL